MFFILSKAFTHNGMYKTVRGSQEVYIHPSSVLFRFVQKLDWYLTRSVIKELKFIFFLVKLQLPPKLSHYLHLHLQNHDSATWIYKLSKCFELPLVSDVHVPYTVLSPTVSLFSVLRDCYCFQYRVFISHLCLPRCINSRRPVHPDVFFCFITLVHFCIYLCILICFSYLIHSAALWLFLLFCASFTMSYCLVGMWLVVFHLKKYSSCRVNPKWIIYHSIVSTDRQYMRNVISIDPSWLREAAPHFYQHHRHNATGHWPCYWGKQFLWPRSVRLGIFL